MVDSWREAWERSALWHASRHACMCGCRVAGVFVISAGVCVPRPHVGLVCVHHSSATLAGRGATGAQRLGAHMRGWKASHFVPVVTGEWCGGGSTAPACRRRWEDIGRYRLNHRYSSRLLLCDVRFVSPVMCIRYTGVWPSTRAFHIGHYEYQCTNHGD